MYHRKRTSGALAGRERPSQMDSAVGQCLCAPKLLARSSTPSPTIRTGLWTRRDPNSRCIEEETEDHGKEEEVALSFSLPLSGLRKSGGALLLLSQGLGCSSPWVSSGSQKHFLLSGKQLQIP